MGPLGPRGFQRRGRRRGLVVGAAVGRHRAMRSMEAEQTAVEDDATQSSLTRQLQELEALRANGILTQAEFEAKKRQVLGL